MNRWIDTFGRLGERLGDFGHDEASCRVIRDAVRANGWFREKDIRCAVEAIRNRMLTREALCNWLGPYMLPVAVPRRVLVVMAGNIPLVGFFDLLCVVVSGHRALVKPSSKDRVLMDYIIGLLRDIDPAVAVELCDGDVVADAVIATGGENAVRHFKAQYADIPTLLRGHRQSVAVLSGCETSEQLGGLSHDIWAYSGLGCRNVSLVFAPRRCDFALPMPAMNEKYRRNYLQRRALLTMTGVAFRDLGCAVTVEECEFPSALSQISVARYDSLDEVVAWLTAHDREIQCVVTNALPHSRRVEFGDAQSPALTDYPDQRDVLEFLTEI